MIAAMLKIAIASKTIGKDREVYFKNQQIEAHLAKIILIMKDIFMRLFALKHRRSFFFNGC